MSTRPNWKNFAVAVAVTTVVLFVLNAIFFVAILKDFFLAHPAVSPEFMKQLYRSEEELVPWAVVVSAVAIGALVTTVTYWSGARGLAAGLKSGFVFGLLLLCSVDFGLYGSTNNFTLAGAMADLVCSTTAITLSGGAAALVIGKLSRQQVAPKS